MRTFVRCLAVLVAAIAPAQAQDLCAPIREALRHAPRDFSDLRVADQGPHAARSVFAQAKSCKLQKLGDSIVYACDMVSAETAKAQRMNASSLRELTERYADAVGRCFPGVAPRVERGPRDWTNRWHFSDVQVLVSGAYYADDPIDSSGVSIMVVRRQ